MKGVLAKDKRLFDAQTMLDVYELDFARENGWATILEHIAALKELIEKQHGIRANWFDAVFAWHEEVFVPLNRSIASRGFRLAFSDQKIGDLYLAVSDHWAYMKKEYPMRPPRKPPGAFSRLTDTA
jgi:hypothetical protein